MDCDKILKAICEYLNEDLDHPSCERLREHLERCRPCRVVMDNVKNTITLYKNEEPCEPPPEFRDKLHSALQRRWEEDRAKE